MQIVNRCIDPPWGVERKVQRSLQWINPPDLRGLDCIYLEDEFPKAIDLTANWAKRAQEESAQVYGWYSPSKADSPAYIMLYIRQIYKGVPSFLSWSTIPTIRIVRTLAHEVAHHLAATRGYINQKDEIRDEELLANRYADNVLQKMMRHWSYRFGQLCLKEIAGWHYAFGNVNWRQQQYKAAANHFFTAWDLDPENKNASYWYWRAKEKCSIESKK